ncbi:MAG: glycerophosphodiester phosphodiesterase [Solirubrobacteraceae bacterium]|jgi:glycerophosphoryl diester phosphodiesterase
MEHGAREPAAPLIVAHRGAWGAAPQNSLEAFERAIAIGCDAIEIDVRRTADDRVVVLHDARVRGRPVGRLEHEQLRARTKAGQAPALAEVLELAAGRVLVDVELKQSGYEEQVMAIVCAHLRPDQYVVTSFRDAVLPAVKRCVPEARAGLLLGPRRPTRELERRVRATGADFLAPHTSLARSGLLDWAGERGLASWVWTANEPRLLRRLSGDPRVAAVITDRPERAIAAAGRSTAVPPAADTP